MARIISVSGKVDSGKDTVVKMIKVNWYDIAQYPVSWETKRFADKLKDFVSAMTGTPRHFLDDNDFKKTNLGPEWSVFASMHESIHVPLHRAMTVREALIAVGDGLRNVWHPDCWVNGLYQDLEDNSSWVIPDMRYPNEVLRTEKLTGICIRVNRPGVKQIDHYSETALDNHKFQYILDNSKDLNYLEDQVKDVINDIAKRFGKI